MARTDAGTRVRSESARGCSPRCSRTVRKPSVMAASATSLVVTPNLRHTLSTSAIRTRTVLYRRLVVTGSDDNVLTAGQIIPARALLIVPATEEARHSTSAQFRVSCDDETCLVPM